jgi:hypothetical protein
MNFFEFYHDPNAEFPDVYYIPYKLDNNGDIEYFVSANNTWGWSAIEIIKDNYEMGFAAFDSLEKVENISNILAEQLIDFIFKAEHFK